jgi:hypothetical protein
LKKNKFYEEKYKQKWICGIFCGTISS